MNFVGYVRKNISQTISGKIILDNVINLSTKILETTEETDTMVQIFLHMNMIKIFKELKIKEIAVLTFSF